MFSVPTLRSIARDTNLSAQTGTPNPSTLMHTDGCQPGLKRRGLRLSGPDVGLGGRVGGYEREAALVYGSSCSFTREISRATINTTVSFKGAVYHTTGFQGPQTDLVFVVLFCSPLHHHRCFRQLYSRMSLNTIKCEFPLLHFK